jgi:hypothetical protein
MMLSQYHYEEKESERIVAHFNLHRVPPDYRIETKLLYGAQDVAM